MLRQAISKWWLLIVVLLLINSCTPSAKETIKIGGLFGLTGYSSEWGTSDYHGALLAIEEVNAAGGINGTLIEFIVEDTRSDHGATVLALTKMVEVDGIKMVLGPTWNEFAAVAVPIAEKNDAVLVSASAGGEDTLFDSDHIFSLWPTGRFETQTLVEHLRDHNLTRIAVIRSEEFWSQGMDLLFKDEAKKNGVVIIKEFSTGVDQKDFKTIILSLKSLDVDAVYAIFASDGEKGPFLKTRVELGFTVPTYSTPSTQSETLEKNYGEYVEGISFAYPAQTQSEEEFNKKYELRFGKRPHTPNAAISYDATTTLIKALRNKPSTTTELINELQKTNFEGVSNTIRFDDKGNIANKRFAMKQYFAGTSREIQEPLETNPPTKA